MGSISTVGAKDGTELIMDWSQSNLALYLLEYQELLDHWHELRHAEELSDDDDDDDDDDHHDGDDGSASHSLDHALPSMRSRGISLGLAGSAVGSVGSTPIPLTRDLKTTKALLQLMGAFSPELGADDVIQRIMEVARVASSADREWHADSCARSCWAPSLYSAHRRSLTNNCLIPAMETYFLCDVGAFVVYVGARLCAL